METERDLREKVDGFLRQALEEGNLDARMQLLRKAVYWTEKTQQLAKPKVRLRDPWAEVA